MSSIPDEAVLDAIEASSSDPSPAEALERCALTLALPLSRTSRSCVRCSSTRPSLTLSLALPLT
eukprot:scaffold75074_cov36-Phaeocystis_antarctica.AAC.2